MRVVGGSREWQSIPGAKDHSGRPLCNRRPEALLQGPALVWKTGQTTCYDVAGAVRDCAGTGEDAEYQAGVAWPEPRFVGGSGAEADCITDQLTDLMWLRTPNITTTVTWQDALDAANSLSACGHSDWRLPNRNEFRSLANYGQADLQIG